MLFWHLAAALLILEAFLPSAASVARASSVQVTAVASTTCGDGLIQYPEECDTSNLNGASCITSGHSGGTLSCAANCLFNADQCTDSAPSSGGGRSDGVGEVQPSVVFVGRAYPFATVVIAEGSAIRSSFAAEASGDFRATVETLSGPRVFTVYGLDSHGRRSASLTFSVTAQTNALNAVSGIFLPPTIDLGAKTIRRGEPIMVSGMTVPQGMISYHVDGIADPARIFAGNRGDYLIQIQTGSMNFGSHAVQTKASAPDGLNSGFSESLNFILGTESQCRAKAGDINCDGIIDIADMSILLYWWQDGSADANPGDMNSDGKVDLSDLSIMFFNWTK